MNILLAGKHEPQVSISDEQTLLVATKLKTHERSSCNKRDCQSSMIGLRLLQGMLRSTEKYGKCMFRSDINSCKITAAVLDVTSWSEVSSRSYPSSFEIKDWCKWASRGHCCSLLHSYTRVRYNISIGVNRQCKQRSQSEEVYHPKAHLQLAIRGDRMRSLTLRSREQLQVVV
ncbi:hypothetical protein IFM89_002490 [Coptis chinensis]|uniref:Uncharacterized protein n=1 Tax=Coptis chinensis TaxID=261450 RepID=A0A835HKJ4_9MAGN|nr:hypothetical protein IFM89_002490 [Coptis chinensis]